MGLLDRIKQQSQQKDPTNAALPGPVPGTESPNPAAHAVEQPASAPAAPAKAPFRLGIKRADTPVPAGVPSAAPEASQAGLALRPRAPLVGGLDANVPPAPSEAESAGSFNGPAGFALRLKVLDSVIRSATGLDDTNIDMVKGHIKAVMKELKASPELRDIVKDVDVANIMVFIRATAKNAEIQVETTQVKRETRSRKKASSAAFAAAFDALDEQLSLESLSSMDTDLTEARNR